jgi:transcriptional regulator GlxA family with amidase domain
MELTKNQISMKQNVGILIFDDAEVLDFAGPFEVFSVTSQLNNYEPFSVFTVAKQSSPVAAVNGLSVNAAYTFTNHPPIDILIIAGGQGTKKLMDDPVTLTWIAEIQDRAGITLSICSGARLLGKLGLLDNKPFCTHPEVYEHIKEIAPAGIPRKEKRFVQTDERIYTSGGISAGIDLSFYIVEKLLGQKTALETARYIEYDYYQSN